MARARVLLVEDEPGLLRALLINLRARQYDVLTAAGVREALATAASRPPDAVILDLGLPDIDRTEVIVELRRWSRGVVDLTAHTVTRADGPDSPGEPVRLTPTEWRILESLARRPGQLVGAKQLLTEIWGPGYEKRTNYLRFHLARLRRKLEDDPAPPPAHRARHGLPVPPVTSHFRYAVQ